MLWGMGFVHRHSLSLVSAAITLVWVGGCLVADPESRWGAFFGNAVADWTGLVVSVVATKHLYDKEERKGGGPVEKGFVAFWRDHPLTLFLLVTGVAWLVVWLKMKPGGRWEPVVGNLVSEWTQNLGFVLLTKKFIERKAVSHRNALQEARGDRPRT